MRFPFICLVFFTTLQLSLWTPQNTLAANAVVPATNFVAQLLGAAGPHAVAAGTAALATQAPELIRAAAGYVWPKRATQTQARTLKKANEAATIEAFKQQLKKKQFERLMAQLKTKKRIATTKTRAASNARATNVIQTQTATGSNSQQKRLKERRRKQREKEKKRKKQIDRRISIKMKVIEQELTQIQEALRSMSQQWHSAIPVETIVWAPPKLRKPQTGPDEALSLIHYYDFKHLYDEFEELLIKHPLLGQPPFTQQHRALGEHFIQTHSLMNSAHASMGLHQDIRAAIDTGKKLTPHWALLDVRTNAEKAIYSSRNSQQALAWHNFLENEIKTNVAKYRSMKDGVYVNSKLWHSLLSDIRTLIDSKEITRKKINDLLKPLEELTTLHAERLREIHYPKSVPKSSWMTTPTPSSQLPAGTLAPAG